MVCWLVRQLPHWAATRSDGAFVRALARDPGRQLERPCLGLPFCETLLEFDGLQGRHNGVPSCSPGYTLAHLSVPCPESNAPSITWSTIVDCRDKRRDTPWACRRMAHGIDTLMGITHRDVPDAAIEATLSEDDGRCILRWASFLWRSEGFSLRD